LTVEDGEEIELDVNAEMALALHEYATKNSDKLGLDSAAKIQVRGFHPVFRVAPSGRLLIELVAQFTQVDNSVKDQFGGIPFRGGCTLIASSNGDIRYLISKPMRNASGDTTRAEVGEARFARQKRYVQVCELEQTLTAYSNSDSQERMLEMMNFANLHDG
jgi:hypothetical protein